MSLIGSAVSANENRRRSLTGWRARGDGTLAVFVSVRSRNSHLVKENQGAMPGCLRNAHVLREQQQSLRTRVTISVAQRIVVPRDTRLEVSEALPLN